MSSTTSSVRPVPAITNLAPHDWLLVERAEEAIREGGQLERWCRLHPLRLFPLDLKKPFRLPNHAHGFFDTVSIAGVANSVMGCVQDVVFDRVPLAGAAERLKEFIFSNLLPGAHWLYPDGQPGGFGVTQSLYKTRSGEHGKFTGELSSGCIDWRLLESDFTWVLITIRLNDFVMDFGPLHKKLDEAVCGVMHQTFVHVDEQPRGDQLLEVSVGYPVVRWAPVPNPFGFGPGKFGTAVKLFSFYLSRTGDITVRMTFAAAPRCQKVFDFGPHWPDPVYGGAEVVRRASLGHWNCQAFHDKVDAKMLAQHCRVHQAFMDGLHNVWTNWRPTGLRVA